MFILYIKNWRCWLIPWNDKVVGYFESWPQVNSRVFSGEDRISPARGEIPGLRDKTLWTFSSKDFAKNRCEYIRFLSVFQNMRREEKNLRMRENYRWRYMVAGVERKCPGKNQKGWIIKFRGWKIPFFIPGFLFPGEIRMKKSSRK